MEPLKPVSHRARLALGVGFFVLFFAAWSLATFGGLIDSMFLKDPVYTLRTGVSLFREFGFVNDVGITIFRVFGGLLLEGGKRLQHLKLSLLLADHKIFARKGVIAHLHRVNVQGERLPRRLPAVRVGQLFLIHLFFGLPHFL